MKWGFIPQGDEKPHYLVVNADESEPGTCKDIPLMLATPHALVEGVIIAAYAIRCHHAFIYVRGEVVPVLRRLQAAVAEAYDAGYLGRDLFGTGYDLDLVVHAGAGAYICGEETALLDSLEGLRGQPRLRPPFPAIAGLYASPTVVNNVESIASVPPIILHGIDWFRSMGTEKSPGFTLYSLSGHVSRPGQYEAPLGITLRELLELRRRCARRPRTEVLDAGRVVDADAHRRAPRRAPRLRGRRRRRVDARHQGAADLRRNHLRGARGRCGGPSSTRTNPAASARRAARAPTGWCRSCAGSRPAQGTAEDLGKLLDISDTMLGRSFCALGDGAASPIMSSLKYFRDEYEQHLPGGGATATFDAGGSPVRPATLHARSNRRGAR